MNIHKKLNAARSAFHKLQLKKTGHNKFAGYYYFELGDFLIPALDVFDQHGLCALVTFSADIASMTIVDTDNPESTILLTSPMGGAQLKGCHEVQNIGAVETYQRRYLWVAALEIVEHDAIDSDQGSSAGRAPNAPSPMPAPAAAVGAARQGTEAFRAYYAHLAKPARAALAGHIEELKAIATKADSAGAAV